MAELLRIQRSPAGGRSKLHPFSSARGRIVAGFGFLVLILVAVAAGSAWQVREHRSDTAAMEEHADTAFLLQNTQVNAESAASGIQRYVMIGGETLVAGDEDLLPRIRSEMAEAEESTAQAIADVEKRGDKEQTARLLEISDDGDSLIAGVEMVIALQQSGDAKGAAAALEMAVAPFREYEDKLEAAAQIELAKVSHLRSEADKTGQVAFLLLLVSGAAGGALGLAASVLIARSIIKPLSSLEETAIAVSEGDLEARAQAIGPRELAHLGAALNQMTESLLDASKRRELEEALRQTEERLHTIVAGTPIILFAIDREGVFTLSEGKGLEALALKPGQVVGRSVFDVFRDVPQIQEKFRRALTGEPLTGIVEVGGLAFEAIYTPLRDQNGDVSGVIGVATDVTERRRAEEELEESERRFRDITEHAAEWVWEVDASGKYTYASPVAERILGYRPEEVLGKHFYDLFHPEDREELKKAAFEAFAHKQAFSEFTNRNIRKDGSVVWLSTSGVPVLDEQGNLLGYRGADTDVTERKRAEEALRESETKFRTLAETVAAGTFIYQGTRIRYVNSAAEALTGYTRAEMLEMDFWEVIAPDFRELARERGLSRPEGEDVPLRYEVKLLTKDGDERWVDFTAGSVEFDGEPAVLGTAFDITDRKRAEETIKHLAYHDALTDLPNRTLFKDRLTQALAQARRKGSMVAVLFLDLDQFKVVNDTLGHAEGDGLLRRVAERLAGLVREGDTVGRVGGDEFVLLLSEASQVEDAAEVAERILESLRGSWMLQGQEFRVTTSIGIALYPGDGDDAESLLRNADTAMYRAKEHGRDNYQLYTPAMNVRIAERLALENSLRHGLEREEFVVYYQPQVNIGTGQVVGVEALVRWQHPKRGLVLPAEFIPAAEETGLIVPLGEWVLRTACAQNKAWQEDGLPPVRVAVNLSARQFQQRNLMEVVAQVLEETGLAPRLLQLEITEGIAMKDVDFTITMLRGLREMGVQLAIDDFGTGYSSLAYLKRLPIDAVKIDRSFVSDLTVDANDAAIATTVIAMAHSLKLSVIAEGVETEEQLAFLNQRRCDEMQGYLFSRPVPAGALEKILRKDEHRAATGTAVDTA